MLTVRIWECGKRVPILGTLDSDGPAHLVPLTEDYEYSGRGSVLIHMTCSSGKWTVRGILVALVACILSVSIWLYYKATCKVGVGPLKLDLSSQIVA